MAISISNQVIIGAFLLVTLMSGVIGHSYVTSPQSRSNQKQSNTGCRGPACLGPCDVSLSKRSSNAAVHTAKRGDTITIQWPRNNHAGGFIRFAWAPTSQSDSATAFDNHVQQINCHEVGGCFPDDPSNPNGGDSGPADGSSRACSSILTVPADLADGQWTLQWAWFGGAFSLGDYYSCVDYTISGGNSGPTPVPVFVGGDYSFPGQQKCKFFNTDKLHVCVNEPCSNPIYAAAQQQSGAPAFVQENFVSSASASTSTSGAVVGSTSTSSSTSSSSTSGAVKTSTSTSTTGSKTTPTSTSTSGSPVTPPTTPTTPTTPSSSSSSGSCVSGYMKCLSDTSYSTCNHEAWGVAQSCGAGTQCAANGNYIYCVAAISTPSTPTPTPTPAPAPAPTPAPVTPPVASSTSTSSSSTPASGSCTLGNQQCASSNTYQTCGNGRNGPTWAAPQQCQAGLSCHASSNSQNIYCY